MKLVILTKENCPWCDKAKDLMREKGLEFVEMDVYQHPSLRTFLGYLGLKTVPQIFTKDERIGGYDDLIQHLGSRGTF